MNLETHISSALWAAIRGSHDARNFTGVIVDAVYVVTDVLREKSDSEADGVALVGHALGGSSPKVKITPLRSESDWNEQKGMEQMLRGIYQGIRNPRSHGKRGDSEADANSIVLFLDFVLRRLGEAQTLFSKPAFLERVFDPHFLKTQHYACLLVDEVPDKYLLEVFYDVYQRREEADGQVLYYFMQALIGRLREEEQAEVWSTISNDFRTATGFDEIRSIVQMIEPEQWPQVSEVARLRIENRFVQEIANGRYSEKAKKCRSGALGTWCDSLLPHFTLRKELAHALMNLLGSDDREKQDYAFQFFFDRLVDLVGMENARLRHLVLSGLKTGDARYYWRVAGIFDEADEAWGNDVVKAAESFEEKKFETPFGEDDDLPF